MVRGPENFQRRCDVATDADRERCRRHRLKKKIAKYGPENADKDMRGRHGHHASGPRCGRWKGGRFVTSHGYMAVRVAPDHPHAWGANRKTRYAYEHILVAEEALGRSLREDELVHHKNEDKTDNRWPENLEVLTVSEHAREHAERRGRDALGRFPPQDLRIRQFPTVTNRNGE